MPENHQQKEGKEINIPKGVDESENQTSESTTETTTRISQQNNELIQIRSEEQPK